MKASQIYRGTWLELAAALVFAASAGSSRLRADCSLTVTGKPPINDLGQGLYLGAMGGLYPDGANVRPPAHAAAGLQIAQNQIEPRDATGAVDLTNGRIVLISVGMSNTTQEFATKGPSAFKPRADADASKNPRLSIVDCAQGGHAVREWLDPADEVWTDCDQRLGNLGLSPAQVQVAWMKHAERSGDVPDRSFPAHAQFHQQRLGTVLRMLRTEYPNLQVVFVSSRTRSYEDNPFALNPEPFAYEENFSVKWLIESQIDGTGNLNFDPAAGPVVAPYIVWGPYLWADGETPRSDGFQWFCTDLVTDYTHPSTDGARKVADQLLAFFKTDPLARPWFLRSQVIGQPPTASISADAVSGPAPLSVQFSANAADPDGNVVETAWTFDDGGFSLSPAPVKTFPVPGNYVVTLTAADDSGNTVTDTQMITVAAAVGPVPAASTWGLVLLSLLLVSSGCIVLKRMSLKV